MDRDPEIRLTLPNQTSRSSPRPVTTDPGSANPSNKEDILNCRPTRLPSEKGGRNQGHVIKEWLRRRQSHSHLQTRV